MVVGGGSGGHITPALAVIREIWELKPRAEVRFWTDFKFYKNVVKNTTGWKEKFRVQRLMAGKFRRYTNFKDLSFKYKIEVVVKNTIDVLKVLMGFLMSLVGLILWRPNVIFLKGGYVCLPVGMVAKLLRIPYLIHDSDVVPGLTNRLLAGGARRIATGMPVENYNYPEGKAVWTGIPVGADFGTVGVVVQRGLKKKFGFSETRPLLVVTGGSLGARRINEAVAEVLSELLKICSVALVAGRDQYHEMLPLKEKYEDWEGGKLKSDFRMWEFTMEMADLMKAADVVVSRAGATTIAELAVMKKAVILVPNARLPGKHQAKNAEKLVENNAVEAIGDEEMSKKPEILLEAVRSLMRSEKKREVLAGNLAKFAKGDAATELAKMVVREA